MKCIVLCLSSLLKYTCTSILKYTCTSNVFSRNSENRIVVNTVLIRACAISEVVNGYLV